MAEGDTKLPLLPAPQPPPTLVIWSSGQEKHGAFRRLFDGGHGPNLPQNADVKRIWIDSSGDRCEDLHADKWFHPSEGSDAALIAGIAYVWITECLYDKHFVDTRTLGFHEWKNYILGVRDGIPKTPEWAASETRVRAREIKALARQWGSSMTRLVIGSPDDSCGSVNRKLQCLAAMQGMDSLGPQLWASTQGAPAKEFCFSDLTETTIVCTNARKPDGPVPQKHRLDADEAGSKKPSQPKTWDISGAVAIQYGIECAVNATVTLTNLVTQATRITRTDNFGDFRLKASKRESGPHCIDIECQGILKSLEMDLQGSIDLGVIHL